jgi:hypothetical protein
MIGQAFFSFYPCTQPVILHNFFFLPGVECVKQNKLFFNPFYPCIRLFKLLKFFSMSGVKLKKKKKEGMSHLGKWLNFFSPPLPNACPVGARQGRERGKGITK